jgi:hypothetical protein
MRTGRMPFPDERTPVVAEHGSIDAAMMAYEPDSAEFDHIQAYRYLSTGKRPPGWIPPIVGSGPTGAEGGGASE